MNVSYYYKYNFVSPESIYAEVKEELRSYFQTGVVDDILFPKYTEYCLKILGRSSFKIVETVLNIEDYSCNVPIGFEAAREVWMITPVDLTYQMPSSNYEQTTYRVESSRELENRCNTICAPNEIKVTYKTNGKIHQTFNCHYLLKPGNIHSRESCSFDNINIGSDSTDTFDIQNGKIITNFPTGVLYIVYYSKEYDNEEYQLVPDNVRIQQYIKSYLKYKCFETIYNNISDETYNQVQQKFIYYKQQMEEDKETAKVEIRLQTVQKSISSIKANRNRFNKFQIT